MPWVSTPAREGEAIRHEPSGVIVNFLLTITPYRLLVGIRMGRVPQSADHAVCTYIRKSLSALGRTAFMSNSTPPGRIRRFSPSAPSARNSACGTARTTTS